ncbi:hypothetical protein A3K64_03050 [Candidatus Micrarchaeota archaeon RBG_16_36_9]|nr:MAG: hypothetical protein A3K64_03050 [Candidatus Micrarchaeota archaeon RBG_16_36_9]
MSKITEQLKKVGEEFRRIKYDLESNRRRASYATVTALSAVSGIAAFALTGYANALLVPGVPGSIWLQDELSQRN